jgi:hypothetical protein
MPLTLRLDPWPPAYDTALQLDEETAEGVEQVDPFVETDDWRPITPAAVQPQPECVYFIDGVRRVDVGVIDEADGGLTFGLLGSFAAGVTRHEDGRAEVWLEEIDRRVVLGAGRHHDPIHVPAGSTQLNYLSASEPENSHAKVLARLQVLMRTLEGQLARQTIDGNRMTFVDGPLTYLMPLEDPILGYVKTHTRHYVSPEHLQIVRGLAPGQRSPVFQFGREGSSRYSWYVCVGQRRALDHSLAGVVRLEVSAMVGATDAVRLADCSTALLPRFASSPAWDPRAPQNLYPVAALESRLHHRLGDRELVRRSIAVHFHSLREAA